MNGEEIVNKIFDLQDMHYQEHGRPVESIGLPIKDYDEFAKYLTEYAPGGEKYFSGEQITFYGTKITRNTA